MISECDSNKILSNYLKLIVERGDKSNILFYKDSLIDLRSEQDQLSHLNASTFEAAASLVRLEV
jgi:hypothetical protein